MSKLNIQEPINLEFVRQMGTKMHKHQFILSYRGKVSQEIMKSLLKLTEKHLESDGSEITARKKVFNIIVDCLQSLGKAHHTGPSQKNDLFMLGRESNNYVIYCGNIINKSYALELENELSGINELNKKDLLDLRKKLMLESDMADVNLISLGLIDISRKSGNRLEYAFESLNEQTTYFTLCTTVNIN